MNYWHLVMVSNLFFISCQSPDAQKFKKSQVQKSPGLKWPSTSTPAVSNISNKPLKRAPEWPEKLYKPQNTQIIQKSLNAQRQISPSKRKRPEWPEKLLYPEEQQASQDHEDKKTLDAETEQETELQKSKPQDAPDVQWPKKHVGRRTPLEPQGLLDQAHEPQNSKKPMRRQRPREPQEMNEYLAGYVNGLAMTTPDIIKATMSSNDPEAQDGLSNLMELFTMNLYALSKNDPNLSVEVDNTYLNPNEFVVKRKDQRRYFDKYTPPRYFTRTWNSTYNAKERTFRYLLCDRRYLRNICQFAIIYYFHTICDRFNCSHNVLPRVWDVTRMKCEAVMKKHNPNPVYKGTFRYYRNNRLSPTERWPLFNAKERYSISDTSETYEDYWARRKGFRLKGGPANKKIHIGRKKNTNGKKQRGKKKNYKKKKEGKKDKKNTANKNKKTKGLKRVAHSK